MSYRKKNGTFRFKEALFELTQLSRAREVTLDIFLNVARFLQCAASPTLHL